MANSTHIAGAHKCRVDQSTLIVIDIQDRLGDAMPGKVLNRVLQNTSLLARTASLLGVPVMQALQQTIRQAPPLWVLPQAGHFVQEHGQIVSERAVAHFSRQER